MVYVNNIIEKENNLKKSTVYVKSERSVLKKVYSI